MIDLPTPDVLEDEILAVGTVDYLDVWFITTIARRLHPSAHDGEVRRIVARAVERLLRSGRIRAGDLYPPGEFDPWPFETDEAIHRIHHELAHAAEPLAPGDIAWFEILEQR